jgi:hypothetical protein
MAGRARDKSVKGQIFYGRRVPRGRLQGVGALDEPSRASVICPDVSPSPSAASNRSRLVDSIA